MSLVARRLEAEGIPTVIIGSGRDIVEQAGVPRFLFVDFPLGNPCGRPGDLDMQRSIVEMALRLAESAFAPETTVRSPFSFDDQEQWRNSFMSIDPNSLQELSEAGERRRRKQQQRRSAGA